MLEDRIEVAEPLQWQEATQFRALKLVKTSLTIALCFLSL